MPDTIPKGLISKPRQSTDFVKGITSTIPYLVRNATGDWRPYLPTYRQQKYGSWETNDCWCLAGINDIATQCNFLKAMGNFPQASLDWFKANGYFDETGSFAFSERFIAIISGVRDEGNDQIELWRLARLNGLLPRADLTYTVAQAAQFGSQEAFAADYFNPAAIKPAMRQKALDCLKYLNIAYEWVGKEGTMPPVTQMRATALHSPLQIGIPVCMETYNSGNVQYCGETMPGHSVLNSFIETNGIYDIRDQYHPEDKTLSADYFIPMVTHGVITPILPPPYVPPTTAIPYPTSVWTQVWTVVYNCFNNIRK